MPFNGSGTFSFSTSGIPVVTSTVISSTVFNNYSTEIATALTLCLTKDGQSAASARIPFANGINSTLVTDSTSTLTGSILTAGGAGIVKALWVGGLANIAGALTVQGAMAGLSSLTLGAAAGTTGSALFKGTTSGTVTLKGADAAGTWTFTLPTDDGNADQVLKTNGSGVTSWATPTGMQYADSRFEIIVATRDMTAATGSVAYTGSGFTPTAVLALAFIGGTTTASWGFSESSGTESIYLRTPDDSGVATKYTGSTGALISLGVAGGTDGQAFAVTSYDSDGFTGTWTKTGSPTGSGSCLMVCFR